jgi:hypothetical protein
MHSPPPDPQFPNDKPKKLSIEIPPDRPLPYDRIPSSFEPMGEIQLRGRIFQRFTSGQIPWWVLITGWVIFGFSAAVIAHFAFTTSFWAGVIPLAIAIIFLIIFWRATAAKLARGRRN